jgi:hypothetical protein
MANTKFQFKRTTVTGRTPNTSDPANTSYIAPGEFALNLADGKLFTSNGGSLITIGSNQTEINADQGNFNNISLDGGISIGTATDNASINSTALFAGNGSVNVVVNTTILSVSNSVANSTISPLRIFVGNSSVNTTIDMAGGSTLVSISKASISTSGLVTVNTATSHGIQTGLQSYVEIAASSVFILNSSNYTTGASTFRITEVPSANSVRFNINKSVLDTLTSKNRKISSIYRNSGLIYVVTQGNHGLITGDVVAVTEAVTARYPMTTTTTGLSITKVNDTTFTYNNGTTDVSFSLSGISWTSPLRTSGTTTNVLLTINKASHGLIVGDVVTFSSPNPTSFTFGTGTAAQTFELTGKNFSVQSIAGGSFVISLGAKLSTASWSARSGSFTGGTLNMSKNETGVTAGTVYQNITTPAAVGGNVTSITAKGVTIRGTPDDLLLRITAEGIFVGNTTSGGFIGPTGFRTGRP